MHLSQLVSSGSGFVLITFCRVSLFNCAFFCLLAYSDLKSTPSSSRIIDVLDEGAGIIKQFYSQPLLKV